MQLIYPPKNVLKIIVFTVVCVLISFSFFLQGSVGVTSVNLEWKVNVGDSKTFILADFYEEADYDGNGDPSSFLKVITTIDNSSVEVLLKKGSTFTIEVLNLNESALIQITYNQNVTSKSILDTGNFLQKTTEDFSYWKQIAKENAGCSTNGDFFTLKQTINGIDSVKKYNMSSGWLEYSHQSYGIAVEEFSSLEYRFIKSSSGFEFLLGFIALFVLIPLLRNKGFNRVGTRNR